MAGWQTKCNNLNLHVMKMSSQRGLAINIYLQFYKLQNSQTWQDDILACNDLILQEMMELSELGYTADIYGFISAFINDRPSKLWKMVYQFILILPCRSPWHRDTRLPEKHLWFYLRFQKPPINQNWHDFRSEYHYIS